METTHCDFKFPLVGGGFCQQTTRMSTLKGIQIDNRDCEISITTDTDIQGEYSIMTEFVPSMGLSCRTYKNGNKLPKKYQKYIPNLIAEHLNRFTEIKL